MVTITMSKVGLAWFRHSAFIHFLCTVIGGFQCLMVAKNAAVCVFFYQCLPFCPRRGDICICLVGLSSFSHIGLYIAYFYYLVLLLLQMGFFFFCHLVHWLLSYMQAISYPATSMNSFLFELVLSLILCRSPHPLACTILLFANKALYYHSDFS